MPLVSTPPPPADQQQIVRNDGWFPDIDLVLLRSDMRIDTTVTLEKLREAVVNAVVSVRRDLLSWKAAQIALDYATLEDVPSDQVGGESILLSLYRRAIASTAAADLVERSADITATSAGLERTRELETPGCDHRRNARWAIRDILGEARTTVELI